jgi:hypothetical protein
LIYEFWYVVACESEPDDETQKAAVDVYGPFDTEVEAKVYAIDLWHDNGWGSVEAEFLTMAQAGERSTSRAVIWPYKNNDQEE